MPFYSLFCNKSVKAAKVSSVARVFGMNGNNEMEIQMQRPIKETADFLFDTSTKQPSDRHIGRSEGTTNGTTVPGLTFFCQVCGNEVSIFRCPHDETLIVE